MFLTEYIMAISAISGLSLQELDLASAIKHTGVHMIVALKLIKKTTISSAGYAFITRACKLLQHDI